MGYKVFVDKPIPEQPAPTQNELDSLSEEIELIDEEPEAKPEEAPKPPAEEAPIRRRDGAAPKFS